MNKRLRIAVVSGWTGANHIGGVENHIRYVTEELKAQGHEIAIFTSSQKQRNRSEDVSAKGLLAGLWGKIRLNASQLNNLKAICRFRPDVVHQHDFTSSLALILMLRVIGYRIVLTNHTGEYIFLKRWFGRLLDAALGLMYDHVIAPSSELRPSIDHSTLIYNGFDERLFFPRAKGQARSELAARRNWDFTPFDFVVLVPRRWAPTKGVIFAIEAAQELPNVCFIFAGSDYCAYPLYRERCLAALSQSPHQNVLLVGDVDAPSMAKLIAASDAVLLPSLVEAVSLSAVEANACGRMVIASDACGNVEFIQPGVNGFLFERGSAMAIVECLRQMLPSCTNPAAMDGCLRAAQANTWPSVARRTLNVLQGTLRASPRAAGRFADAS